jgi:hypothetical protein
LKARCFRATLDARCSTLVFGEGGELVRIRNKSMVKNQNRAAKKGIDRELDYMQTIEALGIQ